MYALCFISYLSKRFSGSHFLAAIRAQLEALDIKDDVGKYFH